MLNDKKEVLDNHKDVLDHVLKFFNVPNNDFSKKEAFILTSEMINKALKGVETKINSQKELRNLFFLNNRSSLTQLMKDYSLVALSISNGVYAIVQGEGYFDLPKCEDKIELYYSNIEIIDDKIINNEDVHVHYAFNTGLINHFIGHNLMDIGGSRTRIKKPLMLFINGFKLIVSGSQIEYDMMLNYNNFEEIYVVEAKNEREDGGSFAIRQLFYNYRYVYDGFKHKNSKIKLILFNQKDNVYFLSLLNFQEPENFNSLYLIKQKKYIIQNENQYFKQRKFFDLEKCVNDDYRI